MRRRLGLAGLLAAACRSAWSAPGQPGAAGPVAVVGKDAIRRGRSLVFPADHGAHPGAQTEWWYLTGALHAADTAAADAAPDWGFQITFFRSRTGLAADLPGRLAPRQILFAHAALTVLGTSDGGGRPASHRHDQRLARWNGVDPTPRAHAGLADTELELAEWRLHRDPADGSYLAQACGPDFSLDLRLRPTQPLLLQGDSGFSRKGPLESQASLYYSQPQLAVDGRIGFEARGPAQRAQALQAVRGSCWLDHEWSDSLLAPNAEGWDWIGFNLFDGASLTAFRVRGATGAAPVWSGGSYRPAGGAVQVFGPGTVHFAPGRRWRSPATGASYPLVWQLDTPAGRHTVRALLDAQELDGRGATGSVYWEGLAELLDAGGRRVGLGYLELTGYAGRLDL